MQFAVFACAFLLKGCFNIFLLTDPGDKQHDFLSRLLWAFLVFLWAGLPISYSFWQNWKNFTKSMQP